MYYFWKRHAMETSSFHLIIIIIYFYFDYTKPGTCLVKESHLPRNKQQQNIIYS